MILKSTMKRGFWDWDKLQEVVLGLEKQGEDVGVTSWKSGHCNSDLWEWGMASPCWCPWGIRLTLSVEEEAGNQQQLPLPHNTDPGAIRLTTEIGSWKTLSSSSSFECSSSAYYWWKLKGLAHKKWSLQSPRSCITEPSPVKETVLARICPVSKFLGEAGGG